MIPSVNQQKSSVPAIDMRSITELAEGEELGDAFVAELIFVFLGDLDERVRAIGLQCRTGDCAGIKATAHAIKGSCSHFGATRLMELSREVEDRAKGQQTESLSSAVDSMVAEAARVRAALEAFREENVPR
jgi:HPt (histidine-containing phosphotransfer) domain-containing protein